MNNALMIDGIFTILGKLISCIITTIVFYQYFEDRYLRLYQSKVVYIVLRSVCLIINFCVYSLNMPIANLVYWILAIIILSLYFYHDEHMSKKRYLLSNIALFFAFGVCESLGAILANVGIAIFDIKQRQSILDFIYTIFGSIVAILMYFIVLKRLFVNVKTRKVSEKQYMIYIIIISFAVLNIGEILFFLKGELKDLDIVFLLIDGIFIIFMNLYLFYLLDTLEENRDLKFKLILYEKQSQSNYEYYMRQMESRKAVLSILHDTRKHIKVLEGLQCTNILREIQEYSETFEKMVKPLLISTYCENSILNIILNEKMDYCKKNEIFFEINIGIMQTDFMDPIDITTIFGNLLDNALEACIVAAEKKIILKMIPFNGFVYVHISNTYLGEIKWKKGEPYSQKGDGHGIGLENVKSVLEKYHGTIQFMEKDGIFTVEFMFNQP